MTRQMREFPLLLALVFLLSGCAQAAPSGGAATVPDGPEKLPEIGSQAVRATATYLPNTNFIKVSIWADPYLQRALRPVLDEHFQALFVAQATGANVQLKVGEQNLVSQWIYALVAPFPARVSGVSADDLRSSWQGQAAGPFAGQPLLMDENTYGMLSAVWGPAASGSVRLVDATGLVDEAWADGSTWAIVPFEALDPRWKVLAVDGRSPVHKDFDPQTYSLKVPISLQGDPGLLELVKGNFSIPPSNRDPSKLTLVAMTGVTALVRATAFTMEQQGLDYPGQDIRLLLQNADITHISNEVPFAADCPYPDPVQVGVRFCSRDAYIGLLEQVGTDVVELTGDHFQDWGQEAVLHTLDLYKQRGWRYYGGGENLSEGRQALLLDHNGNRIAFIGCNAKGPAFAHASETEPGAAACDLTWMAEEIQRLRADGHLVIATFQHQEYYTYAAQADQQRDFRQLAESGAVIVSGSQAHQPQAMEFLDGAFLHYGLGNLFFDQFNLCPACGQGVIDYHIFYDNRYISTELLPIQFIDYARARPMTAEEAEGLFQALFQASGWR